MISFISGTLHKKTEQALVIECGGIGYHVLVSPATAGAVGAVGDKVFVHTHLSVREDGMSLYGFSDEAELQVFSALVTVNRVGHKSALDILSSLSPHDIMTAVITEDESYLTRAKGVGKKTAKQIILDLKDKFKSSDLLPKELLPQQTFKTASDAVNDAIDALIGLDYSQSEAVKAVTAVAEDGMDSAQLIKKALRKLNPF